MTPPTDIDELLRGDFPAEDGVARERARRRLRAVMDQEQPSRPARRGHRARWALVSAAAAVIVLLVVQALLPPGRGGPTLGAAAQIEQLGALSARQPTLRVSDGQFLYVRAESLEPKTLSVVGGVSFTLRTRVTTESWIAPDGSGSRSKTYRAVSFASPADRAAWEEAGKPAIPSAGEIATEEFESGELVPFDVADLPSDPQRLRALLQDGSLMPAHEGNSGLLRSVGSLLAQQNVPGEVRHGLFEVAAGIAEVQVEQGSSDPVGRPATSVWVTDESGTVTLFFDPSNAQLLAESESYPSGAGSELSAWQAFIDSGVADETGVRPSSETLPAPRTRFKS